jgi:hypothetical protein
MYSTRIVALAAFLLSLTKMTRSFHLVGKAPSDFWGAKNECPIFPLSKFRILTLAWVCGFPFFSGPSAFALADKDNQGRWTTPTTNGPDKEVPGFLVNLGPTGARGILTEKTFIVRYIFAHSPAVGHLKLGDEITGVFGKPFTSHHWGGSPHGYDGPIMDLATA